MGENEADGMRAHDYQDSAPSGHREDGGHTSHRATNLSPEMYSALTTLSSNLCAICQKLCRDEVKVLKQWRNYGPLYTAELGHHPSLSSLRESVDASCPFCCEVAQTFEEDFNMKLQDRDTVADSWHIKCYMDINRWCFTVEGLRLHFIFYDSNGNRVNPKLGVKDMYLSFYPAESLGLGPEYLGERMIEMGLF